MRGKKTHTKQEDEDVCVFVVWWLNIIGNLEKVGLVVVGGSNYDV